MPFLEVPGNSCHYFDGHITRRQLTLLVLRSIREGRVNRENNAEEQAKVIEDSVFVVT